MVPEKGKLNNVVIILIGEYALTRIAMAKQWYARTVDIIMDLFLGKR
jgi:hypothetical protein